MAPLSPPEAALHERPQSDITYVNIPISPTSKKQLHYMELKLQEAGTETRVAHHLTQSKDPSLFASHSEREFKMFGTLPKTIQWQMNTEFLIILTSSQRPICVDGLLSL